MSEEGAVKAEGSVSTRKMKLRDEIQAKCEMLAETANNAEEVIYRTMENCGVELSERAMRAAAKTEAIEQNRERDIVQQTLLWVLGDADLPHDLPF